MRGLFAALAALLLLAPTWAQAAIGAPTQIASGIANAGASATVAMTLTAGASVGDLVMVLCANGSSNTIDSIADTQATAYAAGDARLGNTIRTRAFYAILTAPLTTSDTITVTFNATTSRKACTVLKASGMLSPTAAVRDLTGAGFTATVSTTPGFTTATFAQADTLIIAYTFVEGSSASSDSWTEDPAWTSLPVVNVETRPLRTAYKIVSSTTAVTYAPINGTARTWAANYEAYKGAAAAGGASRGLLTLGVGR